MATYDVQQRIKLTGFFYSGERSIIETQRKYRQHFNVGVSPSDYKPVSEFKFCVTLYPQKLAITSPTSGGHSVGIVRSRTQAMEFVGLFCLRLTEEDSVM
jgi:hypothetical protein